jgi:hypothetical protein
MVSIDAVFHELQAQNTKLAQLHADLGAQLTATQDVGAAVNNLDGDVNSGFGQTLQRLHDLEVITEAQAKLLYHLVQQTDTVICSLDKIAHSACGLVNYADRQTSMQAEMRDALGELRDIAETAQPAAALERHRLKALQAEVERCCPPPAMEPPCQYTPCEPPDRISPPELPRIDDNEPPPG